LRTKTLESHAKSLAAEQSFHQPDEDSVEALGARLFVLLSEYQSAAGATPARDQNEVKAEFEEIRQQLASTTLGLGFLITMLESLLTVKMPRAGQGF